MAKILGECPHCKSDVLVGKYGAYCSDKCGMSFGYAFGKKLDENQVGDLLMWRPIYVKGMKRKDGSTYNACLRPERIIPYSYTNKQGELKKGYQYSFSFVRD